MKETFLKTLHKLDRKEITKRKEWQDFLKKYSVWSMYRSRELVLIAYFCFLNNNLGKKLPSLFNLFLFFLFPEPSISFAAGPTAILFSPHLCSKVSSAYWRFLRMKDFFCMMPFSFSRSLQYMRHVVLSRIVR
jgi:hypothetical protein